MYVDEPLVKDALGRLVRNMTACVALREDLLQEALIHLWLTEAHRPGQTKSWYLQSCKFHLQHYLASGRSIDSAKRSNSRLAFADEAEEEHAFPEPADSGNSVLAWVSAREIIALLSRHLLPQERAVLACLADGLGPREIGRRLNISHTMAIKHRYKIASLFSQLESSSPSAAPLSAGQRTAQVNGANGRPRATASQGVNGSKPANGSSHVNGAKAPNGTVKMAGAPRAATIDSVPWLEPAAA